MSLRRKIALWLCPELPQEIEILNELRAMHDQLRFIAHSTACTAEYSRRTSDDLRQVTEGGNAMRANMNSHIHPGCAITPGA